MQTSLVRRLEPDVLRSGVVTYYVKAVSRYVDGRSIVYTCSCCFDNAVYVLSVWKRTHFCIVSTG